MKKIGFLAGAILVHLLFQPTCWAKSSDSPKSQEAGTNALMENPIVYLIRDDTVQAELRLSTDQKQQLRKMIVEMDQTLWKMRDLPNSGDGKEMWQKLHSELDRRLEKILNKQQNKRLREIVFRAEGLRGLLKPEMTDHLKFSPGQTDEIREIIQKTANEIEELRKKLAQQDPRRLEQQSMKARGEENEGIFAILSDSQKKKFIARLGKKFDLSKVEWRGITAPELREVDTWINSSPLTLAQLQGKVVALHFWAFG